MKRFSPKTRAIIQIVLAIVAIITILGGIYAWTQADPFPKPTRPFAFTGQFAGAEWGGYDFSPSIERFNFWKFSAYLSDQEAIRVTQVYTEPYHLQKSGPISWPNYPPNLYEQSTRGNWCGQLPAEGTLVRIESPTGYSHDVTITDLTTGKVYRSGSDCARPVYTFNYRVKDRNSGKIIKEGQIRGYSSLEVGIQLPYSSPNYLIKVWREDEPDPNK